MNKQNDLGRRLSAVRAAAQMSQSQLAAALKKKGFDVRTYTISRWENGISKPTVETFLAICDICKVKDIGSTFSGPARRLRLYNIPVSAGLGNYLESSDYEMIEVDDLIPDSADYALRVSGNSMMPRFVDNQIIFIHEQATLNDGEIGVFFLNNDCYLKKLSRGCLVSLNPKYKPVRVREHDDFKVLGKVIG